MAQGICSIEGCEIFGLITRGWCIKHYRRWQRNGDPLVTRRVAPGTHRTQNPKGYVFVYLPEHPLAHANGYVAEHRMVAWDAGLLTDPEKDVHHKNEIKNDNRLKNLEAKPHEEHSRDHDSIARVNRPKTHCPQGHPYDEANTYNRPDGGRGCRVCIREHSRRSAARRRAR